MLDELDPLIDTKSWCVRFIHERYTYMIVFLCHFQRHWTFLRAQANVNSKK